jgi:hypothetical protein
MSRRKFGGWVTESDNFFYALFSTSPIGSGLAPPEGQIRGFRLQCLFTPGMLLANRSLIGPTIYLT